MIIVRVARGIKEHFPNRVNEWAFAGLLAWLGALFIQYPALFDTSMSYANLAQLADERVWGVACILIAGVRLLALGVNGTFAGTWYSQWSPRVRGVCAFLSCGIWFPIFAGFAISNRPFLLVCYAGTIFFLDAYAFTRTWNEAGRVTKANANASGT